MTRRLRPATEAELVAAWPALRAFYPSATEPPVELWRELAHAPGGKVLALERDGEVVAHVAYGFARPLALGSLLSERARTVGDSVLDPIVETRWEGGEHMRERESRLGLDLAFLHLWFRDAGAGDMGPPDDVLFVASGVQRMFTGYRMRMFVLSAVTRGQRDWLLTSGSREYAERDGLWTMVAHIEDAQERPGSREDASFHYVPPVLGFRPRERSLLRQALQGLTDPEIAAELGLSEPTVKKVWRELYARIEAAAPDLYAGFGGDPIGSGRGAERRRRLLAHLRDHPQEIVDHGP